MRLTEFRKLRNAVANLDWNFIVNAISDLRGALDGRGQRFDKQNTIVTEEGIFYVNPRSGVATKVALYNSEQFLSLQAIPWRVVDEDGYAEKEVIDKFHHYHLLQCNQLRKDQREGWKGKYRASQRDDGRFFYRLLTTDETGEEVYQEIAKQRLKICPNCLIKINSLLGEENSYKQEDFQAQFFFNSGFETSWKKRPKKQAGRGFLSDINPSDWSEISRMRKLQAEYLCEECNVDLSSAGMRGYAYLTHSAHLSDDISFVRLRCLCLRCRAEQADGEEFKRLPEYEQFLLVLDRIENGQNEQVQEES